MVDMRALATGLTAFILVGFVHSGFVDLDLLFQNYVKRFNKPYANGTQEYEMRFQNFKGSLNRIRKLNNLKKYGEDAEFGLTRFSDLTPDEFQHKYLHPFESAYHHRPRRIKHSTGSHDSTNHTNFSTHVPKRLDWRTRGIVSRVKNQDQCGACWAFSPVETIESMNALRTGRLTELSVQQVIDCSSDGSAGCRGGDNCKAVFWLANMGIKLVTEKEYAYVDKWQSCKMKRPKSGVQVSKNFTCLGYVGEESKMIELLATHGPLTVAVDATTWQDYLGGIIRFHCETNTNHAVQVVGYSLEDADSYYIVRNSWGPDYGINGYLHIGVGNNLCGIAQQVSTVDVVTTV